MLCRGPSQVENSDVWNEEPRSWYLWVEPKSFTTEVFAIRGSVTLRVLPRVLSFGLLGTSQTPAMGISFLRTAWLSLHRNWAMTSYGSRSSVE